MTYSHAGMQSIKHFMIDSGWRQADLARALDIHYSYASLILRGERVPSVGLIQKMSELTRIPVEKLIEESGKPPPRKKPVKANGRKP
jgi:transcriptional regulator with XRE-family HTH domain